MVFFMRLVGWQRVGGLFMVADLRRRQAFWMKRWIGGVLFGAGAFQLYDGIVQHKMMGSIKFAMVSIFFLMILPGITLHSH